MKTLHPVIYALALVLGTQVAFSQEQKEETKAYYVGEDGRLYWPGSEPVYLFISQSADGANPKRLESESASEYTNPLYLDTEGANFIRTKWAVDQETRKPVLPKQEVLFEVYNDGTAPVTTHAYSGANTYTENGTQYFGKDLTLSLSDEDALSGTRTTYISRNGAPYELYNSPLALNESAPYTYKYYSVDNVGNVEAANEILFEVDLIAPVSSHLIKGDKSGTIYSPRANFSLKSSDPNSGVNSIFYQIDGQDQAVYTAPVDFKIFEDGEHTITYFSEDNVGNKEEVKTVDFYVDAIAPEVAVTIVGDQYQNRGRVFVSTRTKVKLDATDNKSGVKRVTYKIDDQPEEDYREPFELPKTKGSHTIVFYAVDNVNNSYETLFDESKMGRQGLDIDMDAPEISHTFEGNTYTARDTMFITNKTDVMLAATDLESGVNKVGYKIDGGKGQEYTGGFTIEEEGFHIVDFYGTDKVNNRNTREFFFVVDKTGPEIEVVYSAEPIGSIKLDDHESPLSVYGQDLIIYLGATDKIVNTETIYYTIDDGSEKKYEGPIKVDQRGIVTFKVRAVDNLGNETVSSVYEIFVK